MKSVQTNPPIKATDLHHLSRAIVLVKSKRDHRNPPTALRGTLEVYDSNDEVSAVVKVQLEYPQMFNTPAHHRTITLTPEEVDELLRSESDGVYQIALDVDLAPQA